MFYTYAHYTPTGRLFYIGKGVGRRAWSVKGRNKYWKNIVSKHGDPRIEVLANWSTEAEAFDHEKFLIWCFRDMGQPIANITDGGEGSSGLVHTEAVKEKIRSLHKGKKLTPEHVELLRKSSTGRKHTEETKSYLSKLNKERVLTEDQLQRIKNAHTGKKHSSETRKKISLAHIGKSMSLEHREIISKNHKGKKQSEEQIKKRIASRLATLAARKDHTERN